MEGVIGSRYTLHTLHISFLGGFEGLMWHVALDTGPWLLTLLMVHIGFRASLGFHNPKRRYIVGSLTGTTATLTSVSLSVWRRISESLRCVSSHGKNSRLALWGEECAQWETVRCIWRRALCLLTISCKTPQRMSSSILWKCSCFKYIIKFSALWQDVMAELDLGPNGALLYAMEYIEADSHDFKMCSFTFTCFRVCLLEPCQPAS